MKKIKNELKKIFNKGNINKKVEKFSYPLLDDAFSFEDIYAGIEVLMSKKITMGDITKEFEVEFAKYLNVKYALMVNSGSSANLLASFALTNPKKKNFLKRGDEFLIPALCWSTSLWPMVQAGLKPKFIDITTEDFNVNLDSLKKNISKKTKAIMAVHILGSSVDMEKLSTITKRNNLFLLEDSCESLGSKFKNKYLGTFGDFGTYSFYYSHQITSGEGGMIVCNDKEDYKIIHSLRSHGWDRGIQKKNSKNFNFINSGFNVRPMDITAAIGLNQLRRLNKFKRIRKDNKNKIITGLKQSPLWKNQFSFPVYSKHQDPSLFGFPLLINKEFLSKKKKYINFLKKNRIETRPILSGNFMNQPCIKLFDLNKDNITFKNAQEVDDRGFFIGLHTKPIKKDNLNHLIINLLQI